MAVFYRNWFSTESFHSQYSNFLQRQTFEDEHKAAIENHADLTQAAIQQQTEDLQSTINDASYGEREEIRAAASAICSSVETGFAQTGYKLDDVNKNLGAINDSVERLATVTGEWLSRISQQLSSIEAILKNMEQIGKLPDSQKQKAAHIEKGLMYLCSARDSRKWIVENEFYDRALKEFNAALKIEDDDFFSLLRKGVIYLVSAKHLNPVLAEQCFKYSAKFSLVAGKIGGTTSMNALLNRGSDFYLKERARATLYAAKSCYIQGKTDEAIELAGESWKIYSPYTQGGFYQAVYLLGESREEQAIDILKKAVWQTRELSLSVRGNLLGHRCVREMVDELTNQTNYTVSATLQKIKSENSPHILAQFEPVLNKVEYHLKKNTYLDGRQALDILDSPEKFM